MGCTSSSPAAASPKLVPEVRPPGVTPSEVASSASALSEAAAPGSLAASELGRPPPHPPVAVAEGGGLHLSLLPRPNVLLSASRPSRRSQPDGGSTPTAIPRSAVAARILVDRSRVEAETAAMDAHTAELMQSAARGALAASNEHAGAVFGRRLRSKRSVRRVAGGGGSSMSGSDCDSDGGGGGGSSAEGGGSASDVAGPPATAPVVAAANLGSGA